MECVCTKHIAGYRGRALREIEPEPEWACLADHAEAYKQSIDTQREEILQSRVKELQTSSEDYATQVDCLMKNIDEQKKKIYTLEKLLKLYL